MTTSSRDGSAQGGHSDEVAVTLPQSVEARRARWLEDNREAIEEYNRWFEEHGLILEKYHLF